MDFSEVVHEEIRQKTVWEKAFSDCSYNSVISKVLPPLFLFVAVLETQQLKQVTFSKWQVKTEIFRSQISHTGSACSNGFRKWTKIS